ncbi:hypothetical protein ACQKJG_18125 [Priestia megaterium]|uniref:hypothetical protein n=1 Tax=Priestia megaterium TaxID=1404 RepID=UPI003CFDA8BA
MIFDYTSLYDALFQSQRLLKHYVRGMKPLYVLTDSVSKKSYVAAGQMGKADLEKMILANFSLEPELSMTDYLKRFTAYEYVSSKRKELTPEITTYKPSYFRKDLYRRKMDIQHKYLLLNEFV